MLAHESGWINFEVASEGGSFQKYRTGIYACGEVANATLKAGEHVSAKMRLVTNAYSNAAKPSLLPELQGIRLFPFSEPGSYKIRATYPITTSQSSDHPQILSSNTLEISVHPASEQEKAALAFFASQDELAAAVGADGEVQDLGDGMRRWEGFVERFASSSYTPYVRLHLGTLYLNGTTGSPDPLRAAEHFRVIAESGPAGVADDALVGLAKSQIELGRFDEAGKTITTFLERFPKSERKAEVVRMREGLGKGLRSVREMYSN